MAAGLSQRSRHSHDAPVHKSQEKMPPPGEFTVSFNVWRNKAIPSNSCSTQVQVTPGYLLKTTDLKYPEVLLAPPKFPDEILGLCSAESQFLYPQWSLQHV